MTLEEIKKIPLGTVVYMWDDDDTDNRVERGFWGYVYKDDVFIDQNGTRWDHVELIPEKVKRPMTAIELFGKTLVHRNGRAFKVITIDAETNQFLVYTEAGNKWVDSEYVTRHGWRIHPEGLPIWDEGKMLDLEVTE